MTEKKNVLMWQSKATSRIFTFLARTYLQVFHCGELVVAQIQKLHLRNYFLQHKKKKCITMVTYHTKKFIISKEG